MQLEKDQAGIFKVAAFLWSAWRERNNRVFLGNPPLHVSMFNLWVGAAPKKKDKILQTYLRRLSDARASGVHHRLLDLVFSKSS